MNNPLSNVSVQQLKQAISIRERIEALEAELGRLLGGSDGAAAPARAGGRKRRGMSAAGRARIAAAARERWARFRGEGTPRKRRRNMSAAARARISAAAKARWRRAKAAGRNRL